MRIIAACVLVLTLIAAAHGETDVFMRAVGFALTGSDDAEPRAIDRPNCVFGIKNSVYHLNNVHVDRIKVQGWQRQYLGSLEQWVAVGLHGDDVVVEETTEPAKDDGSEFTRQLRAASPDLFKSHYYTYKERELRLETNDQDRVTRAWTYIYSHGCTGKQSPF